MDKTIKVGLESASIIVFWHTARLASPNEPDGTDHTGEIISFSDVGPGSRVGTDPPRPWYCYTKDPGGVVWQFPNGSGVPIGSAVGTELFIRGVDHTAVALHRGPTHFSPDGEHCCVRIANGPAQRLCVTFSEC